MNQMTIDDAVGPTSQDTARHMKGCLAWTVEDHRAEKEYLDGRYSGRFHHLGATVRVIATDEIGTVQQRNEPWVGGEFYLREQPGKVFKGLELETVEA